MKLTIHRNHSTSLYTMGMLRINQEKRCVQTVENTLTMLPPGAYGVHLSSASDHSRRIVITLPENATSPPKTGRPPILARFHPDGSYRTARKLQAICLGELLIPGALKKGVEVYTRLFDRLEKAEKRHEPITLFISERGMKKGKPIRHWGGDE